MSNKIMNLIKIATRFKGKKTARVEYASVIDGVTVCVIENSEMVYNKTCYLDWENAEERLNTMLGELENLLAQNKAA